MQARVVLASAAAATALIAFVRPDLGDYSHQLGGNPDDAGPLIAALLNGDFGNAPEVQPLMGPASVVVRLPFALVGDALGGIRYEYWLGCFACAWALALLGFGLAARARGDRGNARTVVPLLLLANPMVLSALDAGHPEELLLAATSTAAVWAAGYAPPARAAVFGGLAVATKPLAALALLPMTLASRRSGAVAALAIGIALAAPIALLDLPRYTDGGRALAEHTRVYAATVWYPAGSEHPLTYSTGGAELVHDTVRRLPEGLTRGSGTLLAVLIALAAATLAWRRRGHKPLGQDALALLAAAFAARAFCDPQNLEYYLLPSFVALLAWETLTRMRPPLLSAAVVTCDLVTFHAGLERSGLQCGVFLAWVLPLTSYLVWESSRPGLPPDDTG